MTGERQAKSAGQSGSLYEVRQRCSITRKSRDARWLMPLLILPGCATTTASVETDAVTFLAFVPRQRKSLLVQAAENRSSLNVSYLLNGALDRWSLSKDRCVRTEL